MSEIVMYIIINKDLKMSPGKIAAQAAHVAVKAYILGEKINQETTYEWYSKSYAKIVLKASEYEMRKILELTPTTTVSTIDEGRTEIAKGSLTAIAFVPMNKENVSSILKVLKLL